MTQIALGLESKHLGEFMKWAMAEVGRLSAAAIRIKSKQALLARAMRWAESVMEQEDGGC